MFIIFIIHFLISCSGTTYVDEANQALHNHDLSKAEQLFRKAIKKNPKDIEAITGLAWTYQLAGEKNTAEELFNRCLQLDSYNADCLRGKASVHLSMGNTIIARELIL